MKKSRIFMATGTLVLAVAGILATKANKKFTAVHTAYVKAGSYTLYLYGSGGTDLFTTVSGTGKLKAYWYTSSGTSLGSGTLKTVGATHTKTLYFK